ncbi:MAG: histidine kinase, partial [Mesorhizobium sp.]
RDESTRKGFGTVVLQRVAPQSLNGLAVLDRSPGHLKWSLTAPLDSIIVPQLGADLPETEPS